MPTEGRLVFADGSIEAREPEKPWKLLDLVLGRRLVEWSVSPGGQTLLVLKFEDGYELRVEYSAVYEGGVEFVHPDADQPIMVDG